MCVNVVKFQVDFDCFVVMGELVGGYLVFMLGLINGMMEFDVGDYLDVFSDV